MPEKRTKKISNSVILITLKIKLHKSDIVIWLSRIMANFMIKKV